MKKETAKKVIIEGYKGFNKDLAFKTEAEAQEAFDKCLKALGK